MRITNQRQAPLRRKKRFKHNLSHTKKLTCNLGELVPINWYEVYPADTIKQNVSALIRLAPLAAPVMHKINAYIHAFFVPFNQIWDEDGADFANNFITRGANGNDSTTHPYVDLSSSTVSRGDLWNHLGIPNATYSASNLTKVNALPLRSYASIVNEYYQDIDLQTKLTIDTTSGADTTTNTTLQKVTWEKDYFTTSRPWEQKGDAVSLPLGTSADVMGIATSPGNAYTETPSTYYTADGNTATGSNWDSTAGMAIRGDNTSKVPAI
jgi:hypothetical protein